MKPMRKPIIIALVFLVLAALLRFWIAPLFEQLPAGYSNETQFLLRIGSEIR